MISDGVDDDTTQQMAKYVDSLYRVAEHFDTIRERLFVSATTAASKRHAKKLDERGPRRNLIHVRNSELYSEFFSLLIVHFIFLRKSPNLPRQQPSPPPTPPFACHLHRCTQDAIPLLHRMLPPFRAQYQKRSTCVVLTIASSPFAHIVAQETNQ